jgi:hypothetical protein
MALLRARHVQRRIVVLAEVVPVDLLARLEVDLTLAELARDLEQNVKCLEVAVDDVSLVEILHCVRPGLQ